MIDGVVARPMKQLLGEDLQRVLFGNLLMFNVFGDIQDQD
jgi:hypothetical protein